MSPDELTAELERLTRAAESEHVACHFLLVDLADSTLFKTRHSELDWVTRLRTFQVTVRKAAEEYEFACKALGDGILLTISQAEITPDQIKAVASGIQDAIAQLNKNMKGENSIEARIIVSSGRAFLFEGKDPQGLAVDKLFRMEKFVPHGCIGMTDDFTGLDGRDDLPQFRFPLKGIPKDGDHGLFLMGDQPESVLNALCEHSRAAALWLPRGKEAQPIHLVGGYIEGDDQDTVQVGDMRAKIRVIRTLASLGYGDDFRVYESSEFPNEAFRENIVSIGGPCFNLVTKRLLEDLPVDFEIDEGCEENDETPLHDSTTGRIFNAVRIGSRITRDWGLFVHCRNPSNRERTVIIACGIETHAVDGIVQAFSPTTNPDFKLLMDKIVIGGSAPSLQSIPDFYCIMPFDIEANGRVSLPSLKNQTEFIQFL